MRADPATWRLVLVPHEGAPAVLHEAISRGREAVVAQLAAALGGERGLRAPDPELAAHLLSALADEAARLLLADPDRYPPERVLVLARWFLARMVPAGSPRRVTSLRAAVRAGARAASCSSRPSG